MKLWKLFVLALSLCLLCTCLFACGEPAESGEETPDIAETTPEATTPEVTTPEETTPEETTTEFVCEHPNLVVNNSVPTCDAWGKIEKICEDCGFMEHTDLAPEHNDTEVFVKEMGAIEATCADCGDKGLLVESGRTLTLSAFFGGEFTVSLKAVVADEKCALVIDGKTVGEATFDENGEATLTATDIARGGHAIEIVNSGAHTVRAKVGEVDGYYSRPGALFIEVLPKGGMQYSTFRVYMQTADPSEEYYVCYNFNYKYSTDVSNFKGNSCTSTSNYRIDGATLCRVTMDFDEIKRTDLLPVLGGGEVSFAIMGYAHMNHIVEAAKEYVAADGGAPDFIGGFHGDEWIETVKLLVDGVEVDLKSNEKTVYPCSTVTFEQLTTMYAWATATSATDHGLPVAKHFQNIVLDSTGVAHKQTVEWLRGDFRVKSGYMPMFTMMRGTQPNRFIDTMRMYDDAGNLLTEYKMDPEEITKNLAVMHTSGATAIEYSGNGGVSARVDFRMMNDQARYGDIWVNIRGSDNKLYAPITSSNYGVPLEGELWDVDTHYMIDYVAP